MDTKTTVAWPGMLPLCSAYRSLQPSRSTCLSKWRFVCVCVCVCACSVSGGGQTTATAGPEATPRLPGGHGGRGTATACDGLPAEESW